MKHAILSVLIIGSCVSAVAQQKHSIYPVSKEQINQQFQKGTQPPKEIKPGILPINDCEIFVPQTDSKSDKVKPTNSSSIKCKRWKQPVEHYPTPVIPSLK